MLKVNSDIYIGKQKERGISNFIAENNFFLIIELEEEVNLEQGKEILQKIKEESSVTLIENLASLDQFVSHIITKYNLPPSLSLSIGYFRDKIMYLKTVGQGKVYLRRGNNFAQIIENDKNASGYIEAGDFYIFTTKRFVDVLGSDIELKTIFDNKDPSELVEDLKTLLDGKKEEDVISLFIQFKEDQIEEPAFKDVEKDQKNNQLDQLKNKGRSFLAMFKDYTQRSGKKKTFTFLAVAVIFFILIWSVILGYQRRNIAQVNKKIKLTKELVSLKLDQAAEVAFLNLPRSIILVSEAKKEVEKLKKELGKENEDVDKLESLIKETENKIVKKEDKNYEEFYDLTLDSKDAKGNKLYLDKDDLSIIDQKKGTIYSLSLIKKSLDKNSASEIKKTKVLSTYQDYILIYVAGEGIYKIPAGEKINKVINKDKDWGDVNDMWIYNGNLYLLDSVKGDIYKYLVAEKGYSEKSSYLKGEAGSIKGANSLAIDSSIYIGLDDQIIKYTAGGKDEFSTSWPEKNVKLTKIFTSAEVEKVYGWDKNRGVIYILGKNGTYERQINSNILSKASDFVVFNKSAYILVEEKIYKINLE